MTSVQTVTGPITPDQLGVTLTHEHILNDVTSWAHETSSIGLDPAGFAAAPVSTQLLWDLRHDPFANLDNCRLDDEPLAVEEIQHFASVGGRTVVDATGLGIGRDLQGLARISAATGINIIAGTGYYLDAAQPNEVRGLGPESICQRILDDLRDGEDGIRPGIIGEIGVGAHFTGQERASLHGAFLAQVETGLPIQVHLPAWFRLADDVLDLADHCHVDPTKLVLCHMGPSGDDLDYQERILSRGVWVQYDMIGMEVYYADQCVQCPSDEDNARWLSRLVQRGHITQLLMSQDIFLKSLLRSYGGPGYAHMLQYFVPRLHRQGLTADDTHQLLVTNPRALFEGRPSKEK